MNDHRLDADRRAEIADAVRSVRPSAPVEPVADGKLRATVSHRHREALADALRDVDARVDRFERVVALGSAGLVVAHIFCERDAEEQLARAESKALAEAEARAERALEGGRW